MGNINNNEAFPKIAIYNRSGCFLPLNKGLRNDETEKTVENAGFGRYEVIYRRLAVVTLKQGR
jgi:hypothetical protein